MNQELSAYVNDSIKSGVAPATLRETLLAAGWNPADVDEALRAAAATTVAPPAGSIAPPSVGLGVSASVAAPVQTGAAKFATHVMFPGFGNRLGRTIGRFKERFGQLIGLSLIVSLLPVILSAAATFGLASGLGRGTGTGSLILMAGVGVLIGLILLVISLIFQTALFGAATGKLSFGESLVFGRSFFLSFLLASLLASLAAVPGFIALIIPGVILALRFALVPAVLASERRRGWEAVVRSRDLVYGHTFTLFWNLLVFGLIILAAMAALGIAAALAHPVLGGFMNVVIGVLAAPLYIIFIQLFYEDCAADKGAAWTVDAGRVKKYKIFAVIGALLYLLFIGSTVFNFMQQARQAAMPLPSSGSFFDVMDTDYDFSTTTTDEALPSDLLTPPIAAPAPAPTPTDDVGDIVMPEEKPPAPVASPTEGGATAPAAAPITAPTPLTPMPAAEPAPPPPPAPVPPPSAP